MRPLLAIGLLIIATSTFAKLNLTGLQENVQRLRDTNTQIESAPPSRREQLKNERERLVGDIRNVADSNPRDIQAQTVVARGFVAANEPKEATGFADKAVALAQETGDQKALGAALTIGAVAYEKTGDYAAAAARAKRALDIDPTNKAAMAVYQMSRGRSGSGAAAPAAPSASNAATAAPLPRVAGGPQGSGQSQSSFPAPDMAAAGKSAPAFVGSGAEKALKLTGEAGRRWSLDKAAAMRLLDEAVAADAKNAAARAARARARLEMGDAAGALEDADVALAAGPSAAMHAVKGEALLALGRKGEEMLAHFKAAAELDGSFEARYQELIAGGGPDAGIASAASAPDAERRMDRETRKRPAWLLPAAGAALALLAGIIWLLVGRRRDDVDA